MLRYVVLFTSVMCNSEPCVQFNSPFRVRLSSSYFCAMLFSMFWFDVLVRRVRSSFCRRLRVNKMFEAVSFDSALADVPPPTVGSDDSFCTSTSLASVYFSYPNWPR